MYRVHNSMRLDNYMPAIIGQTRDVRIVIAVVLVALIGLGIVRASSNERPRRSVSTVTLPSALDPARFILNALFVPALDSESVPLRWVDPRPALRCGPAAAVHVNGAPLAVGSLVPDVPFELTWKADRCRAFGAPGPQFDGHVRLTIFREDWGFSAMVEPADLRITSAGTETLLNQRGAATLPQLFDAVAPAELTILGATKSLLCC